MLGTLVITGGYDVDVNGQVLTLKYGCGRKGRSAQYMFVEIT